MAWRSRGVRILLAMLAATVAVGMGLVGMLVTTAPPVISLLLEPFSLLLIPGGCVALVLGAIEQRDPSVPLLLAVTFLVYVGLAYVLLGARLAPARAAGWSRTGQSR